MKIYIPFQIKDIGGTSTFAQKFALAAKQRGHEVTFNFCYDFDRMLVVADAPLSTIIYAKIAHKPIIQRLDGVYHPATPAGRLYWLYNLKMKIIHNWLADKIIYQSQFSKVNCQLFLGKRSLAAQTIIYNGVDISRYSPPKQSQNKVVRLVTFAQFRRRDQIEPLLESVKLLSVPYSLTIYGSFSKKLEPPLSKPGSNSHITLLGKMPNNQLLREINQYDIFLFSDQSACPNSVLEALAAGLPVVAFNRGSIKEIINPGKNGEIVSLIAPEPFTNPYPFQPQDYRKLAESITRVAGKLDRYKTGARKSAVERFNLSRMIDGYLRVIVQ